VSLVLASAKLSVQSRRAEDRIKACRIADNLLRNWRKTPNKTPGSASGPVAGHKGWAWRTREVENKQVAELKGRAVVLEIRSPEAEKSEPSASVEIMLSERRL